MNLYKNSEREERLGCITGLFTNTHVEFASNQENQLMMVNCWLGLVVWDSRGPPKFPNPFHFRGFQTTNPNQQLTISWENQAKKQQAREKPWFFVFRCICMSVVFPQRSYFLLTASSQKRSEPNDSEWLHWAANKICPKPSGRGPFFTPRELLRIPSW